MKVFRLKSKLRDIIEILKEYSDDDEIELVSNTYFLRGCKYFIGISGYNGGYISLDDIEEHIRINDDELDN